jgi:hypothetical protein
MQRTRIRQRATAILAVGLLAFLQPSGFRGEAGKRDAYQDALRASRSSAGSSAELPARYFRLMERGIEQLEERLSAQPAADLPSLEAGGERLRLVSHAVLIAAVLYARRDPANVRYNDRKMLALATTIGDLLAIEGEQGRFDQRPLNDRDVYMWLEAYRVLEPRLGEERRKRWRRELERNIAGLAADVRERRDFPGYQSPFIGTSPNHFALWASTVHLAGRVFGNREWELLGAGIMHRFAAEEQSPDGYWGEHELMLPTPGYDYNTYASVALYAEWSEDPAALKALRRGLDFHKYFTYPDGTPVEVLDDRNRYTLVPGWGKSGASTWPDANSPPGGNDESASKGHFGFSRFSDGRRYAEFLTSFFREGLVAYEDLGRLAQNALYYHAGSVSAIPQDLEGYARQLTVPAGIRKTGPWVVCLSGLISTQAINSQFYHDRQGHVSVFHQRLGPIVTGANSKRQPELATLSEKLSGQIVHMPLSSRLQMSEGLDRLSLGYNTFFSDLYVPEPSQSRLSFRFVITGRGEPAEDPRLNLQLCLKPGQMLETATGNRIILGPEPLDLGPNEIGGWIRHRGWKLEVDPEARLTWPVYPHNPYANAPEKSLQHAVGRLTVPLNLKSQQEDWTVLPGEREISFTIEVE